MVDNSTGAVFISYASEDADAAARIAQALTQVGIECWLDKSGLSGGDAWDRQIRQQIDDCRLFLPIVSGHTEARDEGYFRREWNLAVDRTRAMADGRAFIVPIVIDDTTERGASVPDWFQKVQWMRLSGGQPTPAFCTRIAGLLHAPAPAAPRPRSGPVTANPASRVLSGKHRWTAAGAVGAVMLGAVLWLKPFDQAKQPPAPSSAISTIQPSLAVLPFIDLSQSRDQEFLADGMAEEILDLLARIPGLTVIGRTSSFQFKGKSEDLRAVGKRLGVQFVVSGSVRTSGMRVRVSAQLNDALSGSQRWSESYDREFKDMLALQDEVAKSIARELQLAVGSADLDSQVSAHVPEAYSLYLRGKLAMDRGDGGGFREARAEFERALTLDPTLTRAADGLLLADLNLAYDSEVPPDTGWPGLANLAKDTLNRNPHSAFAHTALAWVHAYYYYDAVACARELDASLAEATHDPATIEYNAWMASVLGRAEAAEGMIRQVAMSDPLNPDSFQGLASILRDAGDLRGAEAAFRRSIQISPSYAFNHLYLAEVLYLQQRFSEALTEATAEAPGTARLAVLAGIEFALGHRDRSDNLVDEAVRHQGTGDEYWLSVGYTMRHENDLAFEWLNKAFVTHDLSLHTLTDPNFLRLHEDPRWPPFAARFSRPLTP